MADNELMPKLGAKDMINLQREQLDYIKKIEKQNIERVKELKRIKLRNGSTGFLLSASVIGVYLYSIYAVKQEKFLDELDSPR